MITNRRLGFFRSFALVLFTLLVFSSATFTASAAPAQTVSAKLSVPGWSGWTSLGKPSGILEADGPVVGKNVDGRLELFVGAQKIAGGEGGIYWKFQMQPNGPWSDWGRFGDDWMVDPAVASNWDGSLDVFVAEGLHIYHRYQLFPNDGWSDWSSIAGSNVGLSHPTAARNLDGRLACAFGEVGYVPVVEQTGAGVNNWTSSLTPGNIWWAGLSPLTMMSNADGRLEIFAMGAGHVYNAWQTVPNGGWSASWGQLEAPPLPFAYWPVVGQNADGRLEVFGADTSGNVWHRWQLGLLGLWSDWTSLGKPAGVNLNSTQVARLSSGRLIVFSIGADGALWAIQQTPALNAWESWFTLGKPSITFFRPTSSFRGLTAAQNENGYLSIFVTGDDGAVWELDQWRTSYVPLIQRSNY